MATDPGGALTASQALAVLAPLIGGAGISGIIVAVFGYLKAAREGRRPALDAPTQMGLATLFTDRAALEDIGQAVNRLAASIEGLGRTVGDIEFARLETLVDEVRALRRVIDDAATEQLRAAREGRRD